MVLAPKPTPRRFAVLQQRLKELTEQQRAAKRRGTIYQELGKHPALHNITAIHSEPIVERLQHVFGAPPGNELRAALLDETTNLRPTSAGIANTPFTAKIGIISDLFLYKSFEGLADFHPIYPQNYQHYSDIDMLLLVSTWRGIDGVSWEGLTRNVSEKRELLFDTILPFFRRLDIPIVFYSKEDPPNYKQFLSFAQQSDYIFTSAAEMIPEYQRDCPQAKSIAVLPFGINPKNHSPIGSQQGPVERIVPFAGSWFTHKYPDRNFWGSEILDAVVASEAYDLVIFDRNSHLEDPRYKFPDRFANLITPAVDHQALLDIQRKVDVSINLNSVSGSTSMFANRAIELQAQGMFVLSNYNVGLNSRYPHVHLSNGFTDTLAALNHYDEPYIRSVQAAGIRRVFSHDLASMRIATILQTVGINAKVSDPRVVVVKHQYDDHLDQDIARQSYEHIIDVVDANDAEDRTFMRGNADVIVHMDTTHEYAPTHIEDLVNAFRYTDALAVEKIQPTVSGEALYNRHSYTGELKNITNLSAEFIGSVPDTVATKPAYQIDDIGIRPRAQYIEIQESPVATKPPILSVVVPIYNNGPHLLHKCMASLRRSSIFEQMEIVLVDDGSTDPATTDAVEELERELHSVQVYRYEQGGSGSASRPRNKGLELASCDYLTYLDPDNEALNDAYVKLLHLVIESGVDFAVGDMTRWRETNSAVRYTKFLQGRLGMESYIGSGGAQALVDMQFMPISIQAIVARTAWLRDIGISQPVGAVGQDSYFFQQMLYFAKSFAILELAAHTYYAQVENSVVNTVNAKFFDKYLPLEEARSKWLSDVGLLEEYRTARMETFFTGWYLRKLEDVVEDQRPQAIATIQKLGQMYGKHEWQTEEAREFWAASAVLTATTSSRDNNS